MTLRDLTPAQIEEARKASNESIKKFPFSSFVKDTNWMAALRKSFSNGLKHGLSLQPEEARGVEIAKIYIEEPWPDEVLRQMLKAKMETFTNESRANFVEWITNTHYDICRSVNQKSGL